MAVLSRSLVSLSAASLLAISAIGATGQTTGFDPATRQRVIDAAITNMKEHYFDRDLGRKIADALAANAKSGEYDATTDPRAFADLVTHQMREISQDNHLELVYSETPIPPMLPTGPPGLNDNYRITMRQNNCTFEKIELLAQNIGYIKLNSFPQLTVCRDIAILAMNKIQNANAIIFDLRDNGGGFPEMTKFIASYFFDHPVYWYNPREATTEQSWTGPLPTMSKLASKPLYVLISSRTWSGAEQFSYNMKMLKRATLIGETTRGGAHSAVFYRIDDHFGIAIPEVHAINPYGKNDWEGTGVEPDVKASASDALQKAEELASSKPHSK